MCVYIHSAIATANRYCYYSSFDQDGATEAPTTPVKASASDGGLPTSPASPASPLKSSAKEFVLGAQEGINSNGNIIDMIMYSMLVGYNTQYSLI